MKIVNINLVDDFGESVGNGNGFEASIEGDIAKKKRRRRMISVSTVITMAAVAVFTVITFTVSSIVGITGIALAVTSGLLLPFLGSIGGLVLKSLDNAGKIFRKMPILGKGFTKVQDKLGGFFSKIIKLGMKAFEWVAGKLKNIWKVMDDKISGIKSFIGKIITQLKGKFGELGSKAFDPIKKMKMYKILAKGTKWIVDTAKMARFKLELNIMRPLRLLPERLVSGITKFFSRYIRSFILALEQWTIYGLMKVPKFTLGVIKIVSKISGAIKGISKVITKGISAISKTFKVASKLFGKAIPKGLLGRLGAKALGYAGIVIGVGVSAWATLQEKPWVETESAIIYEGLKFWAFAAVGGSLALAAAAAFGSGIIVGLLAYAAGFLIVEGLSFIANELTKAIWGKDVLDIIDSSIKWMKGTALGKLVMDKILNPIKDKLKGAWVDIKEFAIGLFKSNIDKIKNTTLPKAETNPEQYPIFREKYVLIDTLKKPYTGHINYINELNRSYAAKLSQLNTQESELQNRIEKLKESIRNKRVRESARRDRNVIRTDVYNKDGTRTSTIRIMDDFYRETVDNVGGSTNNSNNLGGYGNIVLVSTKRYIGDQEEE